MNLIGHKSLDKILGMFQKTLTELESFEETAKGKLDTLSKRINDLEVEQKTVSFDIERAAKVRKNIQELLNG